MIWALLGEDRMRGDGVCVVGGTGGPAVGCFGCQRRRASTLVSPLANLTDKPSNYDTHRYNAEDLQNHG